MDGIFISYRRDDTAGYAGRLYDRLAAHFGTSRVFMDVEGIEPGTDFVDAIEHAVVSCQVLIVLIGDGWANAKDAAGRRRLDDPNDFIRLETSVALKRNIRVVPVLVDGAAMPRGEDLPEELQALTRRQAIEVSHKQWDASTGELIRTLERILGAGAATPTSAAPASPPASVRTASTPAEARRLGAFANPAWLWPASTGAALVALGGAFWFGGGQRIASDEAEKSSDKRASMAQSRSTLADEVASVPDGTAKVAVNEEKPAAPSAAAPTAKAKEEKAGPQAAARPAAPARPPPPPAPPAQVAAPAAQPAPVPLTPPAPASSTRSAIRPQPAAPALADTKPEAEAVRERVVETEAEVGGQTGQLVPAPAARAKVAVAAPAAKPELSALGGLPQLGQSWTYRATGKWRTSPTRRFRIVVQAVAGNVVTDTLNMIDPARDAQSGRSTGGMPAFVSWKEIGLEFSPYLASVGDIAHLQSQSGFATPDLDGQWSDWYSKVTLVGRESVSVPAGRFDAFKVEVWSSRHRTGSPITRESEPVTVHYHVWYAPEVKRYVKMVRRVVAASSNELEADVFELVSR